ncbi:hypothetical protein CPS_2884 [Colwellia psychrerythraea 34H]|uniref:Uncharacterized protein n=1 Tax=Colwellia psychrerythraea (strain 34H / ATCC BAA-681) TaxID=167879 RepID=Q480D0_COLP3|nr:hypothetical protein CPS_2884 [Colwellia psychrerythraea 34H]
MLWFSLLQCGLFYVVFTFCFSLLLISSKITVVYYYTLDQLRELSNG